MKELGNPICSVKSQLRAMRSANLSASVRIQSKAAKTKNVEQASRMLRRNWKAFISSYNNSRRFPMSNSKTKWWKINISSLSTVRTRNMSSLSRTLSSILIKRWLTNSLRARAWSMVQTVIQKVVTKAMISIERLLITRQQTMTQSRTWILSVES